MTNLTHPIMKDFCKKWNCDFLELSGTPPIMSDDNHPHFRIMDLYKLFNDYDRIINIDSDMVITDNCPNPFEEVPENAIGTIFEDVGSRRSVRVDKIQAIQQAYGNVNWNKGYINTGIIICSKQHKDIFQPINGKYWTAWGSDDVHIGYQIRKLGHTLHELSFKWNHMTMFSEGWNNNADRFNSYIIHYAGRGQFNTKISRIENIKNDIANIYKEQYNESK